VIHHASVEVSELERSAHFYDALLGPLGWRRHLDTDQVIGWGIVKPVFFASTRREASPGGGHICFSASGISAWEGGVAAGGADDGPPGNRPQYGPTYYSAYLLDPDGHRVEVAVGTD
jgi:catechol 2,3-dioxygenase-like lactoylglutathione lyase family enzyme